MLPVYPFGPVHWEGWEVDLLMDDQHHNMGSNKGPFNDVSVKLPTERVHSDSNGSAHPHGERRVRLSGLTCDLGDVGDGETVHTVPQSRQTLGHFQRLEVQAPVLLVQRVREAGETQRFHSDQASSPPHGIHFLHSAMKQTSLVHTDMVN